jgi:ankyrin repeat protein
MPLHCALRPLASDESYSSGFFDTTQLLLDHGAVVEAEDDEHWTPLHLASFEGKVEAVRLLLNHGANVDMHNKEGEIALQVASARGYEEVACSLSDHAQREGEREV